MVELTVDCNGRGVEEVVGVPSSKVVVVDGKGWNSFMASKEPGICLRTPFGSRRIGSNSTDTLSSDYSRLTCKWVVLALSGRLFSVVSCHKEQGSS